MSIVTEVAVPQILYRASLLQPGRYTPVRGGQAAAYKLAKHLQMD
jgi:hypothetical protein